ncbi:hypothetical protein KUV57_12335 [Epibacterium sp. DP7N7-1]|nr:hypothetical protein [Epibacterium sp. DP7N7-1]
MSYKLHYSMLLPVEGMIDENGVDLTHEKAAAALRSMADHLEANPEVLKQILGKSPVADEREDRWVLRSTTKKNVICKAGGGWVEVDSRNIDLEDTRTSEQVASMSPGADEHSVWVRPENIGYLPVLATLRGEDGAYLGQVDLCDWMAWSWNSCEIDTSIAADWDFTQTLDWIADDEENPFYDDPNILTALRKEVPFTMKIEESEIPRAIEYLDELYPGFIDQIGARPSDDDPSL